MEYIHMVNSYFIKIGHKFHINWIVDLFKIFYFILLLFCVSILPLKVPWVVSI
jgi:hypothetical protein